MLVSELSTKDQILATASRLFLKQGYNQTGINQIIEEAGVAKASLYYHFGSKEDLCVAYLHNSATIWQNGLEKYLSGITDPESRILQAFDYRVMYMKETDYNGCNYIRILSEIPQQDNKVHKEAVKTKEMHRNFFKDHIRQMLYLSQDQKNDLTNTILLLFDGGTIQCHIYKNISPLINAHEATANLLSFYKQSQCIKLSK